MKVAFFVKMVAKKKKLFWRELNGNEFSEVNDNDVAIVDFEKKEFVNLHKDAEINEFAIMGFCKGDETLKKML